MAPIVLVHGAFNELWGPNELKARWLPAVRDGLWHHGVDLDGTDVEVCFYGDLFRRHPGSFEDRQLEKSRAGVAEALADLQGGDAIAALGQAASEATFERTAPAFDNPDFIDVVIHSYRHRYGLVPGDPAYAPIEAALAKQPTITVPAVTIDGDADGVNPGTAHHAEKFAGPHEHRLFRGAGHNLPQERPEEFARAILDARAMALT